MAYKSNSAVRSVESFSSTENNSMVAIWDSYTLICWLSRRAPHCYLESLQVCCFAKHELFIFNTVFMFFVDLCQNLNQRMGIVGGRDN